LKRPIALELISRVAGGWNVRMTLDGKRLARFFADARFGGKGKALAAAKEHRDQLLTRRADEPRRRPKPLLVARGGAPCYQIRLPKKGGGTTTTEFSVGLHGTRQARQMAIDALAAAERTAGLAGPAVK
jgi:hypothetical protein